MCPEETIAAAPDADRRVNSPPRVTWLVGVLVLAAVYIAAAKLGLSMAFVAEQVTAVWPPTGIALAALVLFGWRLWPGIFLGAFAANVTAHETLATAVGVAAGNTLEALAGYWLLRRAGFNPRLERLRDVLALVVLAGALSTMVSATVGIASLYLGGVKLPASGRTIAWGDLGNVWWVWWLGDAMGDLVVAPLLLTWATGRVRLGNSARAAEAAALAVGVTATAALVFVGTSATSRLDEALVYTVFPFVVWAALRFGQQGATAVTVLACALAVWGTVSGSGPFAEGGVDDRLVLLVLFMGVTSVTALLLSAAVGERRAALEALTDADRRKDEFLAMLGHELRNPLAPIRNAARILRSPSAGSVEIEQARGMIERQVGHMARLIDDLLDVSRISRGKVELRRQLVTLAEVAGRAVEVTRPRVEARRQKLAVSLPAEPAWLDADPTRVAQVLANLLDNACKYTEPEGRIWLSASVDGAEAVIAVRDNGVGIPAALLDGVFDLFTQADRSLARSQGGLGIGLTVARRLTEMHGGTIHAVSAGPGKGSEFSVRLPLARPPLSSLTGEPTGRAAVASARRVLVVDDNVDGAESMAALMRAHGHDVRTAHDGRGALEAARAFRPEVVLLDLGLPEMDGFEVARRLRAEPGADSLILVAVTGYGREEDRQRSAAAGFDRHLVKPVEPATLEELLAAPAGG